MSSTAEKKQIPRKSSSFIERIMADVFTPPDDLTVSQWAAKYRVLTSEASAEAGLWRNSRTPYLREIMDAFTDPNVRHLVMVAASQVGKTECELNIIGYIIDQDPGSILYVHPTEGDAKEFSRLRIDPMFRDSPTLKKKIVQTAKRNAANTVKQKSYPGGILTLCGSTEAHALASKPIRYVIGDERDRWATSAGDEGDPWRLAMARQKTFYNAKAVEVSTPTIKGHSAIADAYVTGTMERWVSQCPHCGGWHEIRWQDIRFEYDVSTVRDAKTYKINKVYYVCPGCGSISDEQTMKRQPARWQAENPTAYKTNRTRSFWLNAFVSAWASWTDIIQAFLTAGNDSKKLQTVFNTDFGELWEDRGDLEDEDSMLARREEYPAELPEGVLVLTCGVDTQDNRFEYEVVGHGHFSETWGIERGVIMGRPDDAETWAKLDDVLNKRFHYADGISIPISLTFVDEGGHFTMEVRQQCKLRERRNVYAIKGMPGQDKPYTGPPKKMSIVVNQRVIGYCWQYQIGVDSGKQIIMDNLHVQEPGSKYCHFPKRDDYGPQYFKGLLSEHKVYDANKKHPWSWVKIPGHERNEPLDCRNYAVAGFKSLPTNLDEVDRRLKAARGQRPAGAAPVARRPAPRKKTPRVNDEW